MKKIIISIPIFITLFSCYKPVISYKYYHRPEKINNHVLKFYNAENPKYSLIIFTSGFERDSLKIKDNDTIQKIELKSNPSMGLADIFRVINTSKVVIYDITNHLKFFLSKKEVKKHKFVYIRKKGKKYYVTYSHSMARFM